MALDKKRSVSSVKAQQIWAEKTLVRPNDQIFFHNSGFELLFRHLEENLKGATSGLAPESGPGRKPELILWSATAMLIGNNPRTTH